MRRRARARCDPGASEPLVRLSAPEMTTPFMGLLAMINASLTCDAMDTNSHRL
jgi:hypothetical protein